MSGLDLDESEFMSLLKSYVDSCFLDSNKCFCDEFDINALYFEIETLVKKDFIIKCIREEQQRRANGQSTLENYKKLSALLVTTCLQLKMSSK